MWEILGLNIDQLKVVENFGRKLFELWALS